MKDIKIEDLIKITSSAIKALIEIQKNRMYKLNVLCLHGFRGNPEQFNEIVKRKYYTNREYLNILIPRLPFHDEFEVKKPALFPKKLFGAIIGLSILNESGSEYIINKWDRAIEEMDNLLVIYVDYINKTTYENGHFLIVAHSLGTELARLIAQKIRSDIKITILCMGGVANTYDYEDLANMPNIEKILNFYINYDLAIDEILPGFYSDFTHSIGVNEIDAGGVENIKMPYGELGHSAYFKSKNIKKKIDELINNIIN